MEPPSWARLDSPRRPVSALRLNTRDVLALVLLGPFGLVAWGFWLIHGPNRAFPAVMVVISLVVMSAAVLWWRRPVRPEPSRRQSRHE